MKSLQTIFSQTDKKIGISSSITGNEKLIKNPHKSDDRRIVPSYIEDFTWQNCKKEVQFDIDRQTEQNWNWNRNNLIIKQIDRTYPAIADYDQFKKRIRGKA